MKVIFLFLNLAIFTYAEFSWAKKCNAYNFRDFIKTPGIHNCDLRKADLKGLFLQGANLAGADLREADLRWRDLHLSFPKGVAPPGTVNLTNLAGADLRGADLRGADLQTSILNGADFTGADLRWAKLKGSKVIGAKFQGALLTDDVKRYLERNGAILETNVSEKPEELTGCRFQKEPIYIKTKGCGGFCSGYVLCLMGRVSFGADVTCKSKNDDCPSASDCLAAHKPENTFFVGTPSEYKKQTRSSSTGAGSSTITQPRGTAGSSGATQ